MPGILLAAILSAGCAPDIASEAPPSAAVAIFDPTIPEVPLPNFILSDASTGTLAVPTEGRSAAQKEYLETYVNTLSNFPPGASIEFTVNTPPSGLDLASIQSSTHVLNSVGYTEVEVDWSHEEVPAPGGGTWTHFRGKPRARLAGGAFYLTYVGPGAKDKAGAPLTSTFVFNFVKSRESLVGSDGNSRVALATADARQLEVLRKLTKRFFDDLEEGKAGGTPIMRKEIALLWFFAIHSEPQALFDPVSQVIPLPNDLLMDTDGTLNFPIADGDSEAQKAFFGWLNEQDGFSVATPVQTRFNATIDAGSLGGDAIRVYDLGPSPGDPKSWSRFPVEGALDDSGTLLTLKPKGDLARGHGLFDPGRRYLAVLTRKVANKRGKTIEPSEVFAFLRLVTPLVDETGKSQIPGIPDASAAQLEAMRKGAAPLLDGLDSLGLPRSEVALMWTWRTTTRSEALFDPPSGTVPFPIDILLSFAEDGSVSGVNLPALPDMPDSLLPLLEEIRRQDGFSPQSDLRSSFSRPLDPASLTLATDLKDPADVGTAGILILDVTGVDGPSDVPALLSRPPYTAVDVLSESGTGRLILRPKEGAPFKPGSRLLVLLTRNVRTEGSSEPPIMSPIFRLATLSKPLVDASTGASLIAGLDDATTAQLEQLRTNFSVIAGLTSVVTGGALTSKDIAMFWTFTVSHPTAELSALAAGLRTEAVDTSLKAGTLAPPDPTDPALKGLDLTGIGQVMLDGRFEHRAMIRYQDIVLDATTGKATSYPHFTFNEDGSPIWTAEDLDFVLVLPSGTPPPEGWPVVIFQHPFTMSRLLSLAIAGGYAQRGMATLAIDAYLHGNRVPPGVESGALFFAGDVVALRDHVRQTVLDLVALARFAKEGLDPALRTRLGVTTPVLDTTRLNTHGMSLGGIIAAIFAAVEPDVDHTAISVSGGGLVRMLLDTSSEELRGPILSALADAGIDPDSPQFGELIGLAQWLLDSADPLSYAGLLLDPPGTPSSERRAFLQMATEDELMPKKATLSLWKALGGPARSDAAWFREYSPACHFFLFEDCEGKPKISDPTKVIEAQSEARTDLGLFLDTGSLP